MDHDKLSNIGEQPICAVSLPVRREALFLGWCWRCGKRRRRVPRSGQPLRGLPKHGGTTKIPLTPSWLAPKRRNARDSNVHPANFTSRKGRNVIVLLTGATGFIGRHLAARLAALGHELVCAV